MATKNEQKIQELQGVVEAASERLNKEVEGMANKEKQFISLQGMVESLSNRVDEILASMARRDEQTEGLKGAVRAIEEKREELSSISMAAAALALPTMSPSAGCEPPMVPWRDIPRGDNDARTIDAALDAHGIDKDLVINLKLDKEKVYFVTAGAAKLHWKPGDEVEQVDEITASGIDPHHKKRRTSVGRK